MEFDGLPESLAEARIVHDEHAILFGVQAMRVEQVAYLRRKF